MWVAEWYGSRIARYDSEGRLAQTVTVPAKQTSSVAFAGPGLSDLVITSAAQSEPMPIMPPGYDPGEGCFGGALYRGTTAVPGKKEHRCRLRL